MKDIFLKGFQHPAVRRLKINSCKIFTVPFRAACQESGSIFINSCLVGPSFALIRSIPDTIYKGIQFLVGEELILAGCIGRAAALIKIPEVVGEFAILPRIVRGY